MRPPDFAILYDDESCLVVNKPSGVLTQAPPGIDSLELRIKDWVRARDQRVGRVYLGVPHRLDRPASGAMIFALISRAAQRVSRQFERREVRKVYWAGVEGVVEPAVGLWQDHMRKVPDEPRAEVVPVDHPEAQLAVLNYRTLAVRDGRSWLEIELQTGRTHQIRVQAASRGWPILGDRQYGSTATFGEQFDDERLRAIALHARRLELTHPMTREPLRVAAPTSDDWPALDDNSPPGAP